MNTQDIITDLCSFVSTEFADRREVSPDERLMPGIVDSLGVFVLAEHIQHTYGVALDDVDMTAEALENIRALVALIEEKRRLETLHATPTT